MKRFRQYNNGSFALALSRNPNRWVPFDASTPLEDALKIAGADALRYDEDCLEAKLLGVSVETYRDQKRRAQNLEERRRLNKILRETSEELSTMHAEVPEPVELIGQQLRIAMANTESFFSKYVG